MGAAASLLRRGDRDEPNDIAIDEKMELPVHEHPSRILIEQEMFGPRRAAEEIPLLAEMRSTPDPVGVSPFSSEGLHDDSSAPSSNGSSHDIDLLDLDDFFPPYDRYDTHTRVFRFESNLLTFQCYPASDFDVDFLNWGFSSIDSR